MERFSQALFDKSAAFLEVAIISSKEKSSFRYNTSEYSNVTAYLTHHSIELFLKFAISAFTNETPEQTHDIKKLYDEYNKLYTGSKFKLDIPQNTEMEFLGFTNAQIQEYHESNRLHIDMQLRYPVGNNKKVYLPITMYDTDYLKKLEKNMEKIYLDILNLEV